MRLTMMLKSTKMVVTKCLMGFEQIFQKSLAPGPLNKSHATTEEIIINEANIRNCLKCE